MSHNEQPLSVFPAFFKVRNKHVLVVGSGLEALAKIRLIAQTSAQIVVVAPNPEPQLYAYLKELAELGAPVKWHDVPFDVLMLEGVVLVFAATGDFKQDYTIATTAQRMHILVNVVDRPELCDFFTPALVNRAPVAVAIGTEGSGPVLTQLIRLRIETLLYPGIGHLARFADRFRKKAETCITKGKNRRRFWRTFFSGAVACAIFRGDEAAARVHAERLLTSHQEENNVIYFLWCNHGVIDWLTLGEQRALMEADIIIHDINVGKEILRMARRDACLFCASTLLYSVPEFAKNFYRKGKQVLRLIIDKDQLATEVKLLGVHDIKVEIIPSLSAAVLNKDGCLSDMLRAQVGRDSF
ncbi:MAG: uroporphyrin-III C-methyltransferase / precorrin-2 dehydrogenase / sirohydrochlorin ferrochelatase [Candidatus Tokpelaia sp. JSC188]|nr:MAG: uroporphyrin-III C-methyltransferase / precorrin-2 dehydrogenase / sirohydrochlorin ferrochelatase [Candidatus Tokpelaia sp. JSC188]